MVLNGFSHYFRLFSDLVSKSHSMEQACTSALGDLDDFEIRLSRSKTR
jgi:hypothetical protein